MSDDHCGRLATGLAHPRSRSCRRDGGRLVTAKQVIPNVAPMDRRVDAPYPGSSYPAFNLGTPDASSLTRFSSYTSVYGRFLIYATGSLMPLRSALGPASFPPAR